MRDVEAAALPVVMIGPRGVTIRHQFDEFVRVAELVEACTTFAASACYCLGQRA